MSTAQGERRLRLAASRSLLYSLPANTLFELPGRPHVVYQLRTYATTGSVEEAAQQARNDSPFLFKAFETGQIGPKRLARIHGDKPRVATIHEYLDWTVTAQAAEGDDELDFGGFRVLLILPRYRSGWPPPGGDVSAAEAPRAHPLGAPKSPMPALQSHGKPVTAATIRSGPGYLEIPFVATHENKRGRGYCRCLVEAIEDIARALGLTKLMLCSTNDAAVQSTWRHLGFQFASDEQMEEWDILHTDLVYLQNTTQMHKDVPPRRRFKSIVIRHEDFKQRTYAFVGHKRPQRPGGGGGHGAAKRLNSRRSVSSAKEDSQQLAAREQALSFGAVPKGNANATCSATAHANSSPAAASTLGATPRAASSAVGRVFSDDKAPDLHQVPAAGGHLGGHGGQHLRGDEGMAAGGPPTPPPADGGPSRPLHAHAASAPLGGTPASGPRSRLGSAGLAGQHGGDVSALAAAGPGFGVQLGRDLSGGGLPLAAGPGGGGDGMGMLGLGGGALPHPGPWLGPGAAQGGGGLEGTAMRLPVQPLGPHGGFGQPGVQAGLQPGLQGGVEPLGGLGGGMYPVGLPQAGQPFGSLVGMPPEPQPGLPLAPLYSVPPGMGASLQLNPPGGPMAGGGLLDGGGAGQQAGVPYPGLANMQFALQPRAVQGGLPVGHAVGGVTDAQRQGQLVPPQQLLFGGLQQRGSFGLHPGQPPSLPDSAG